MYVDIIYMTAMTQGKEKGNYMVGYILLEVRKHLL